MFNGRIPSSRILDKSSSRSFLFSEIDKFLPPVRVQFTGIQLDFFWSIFFFFFFYKDPPIKFQKQFDKIDKKKDKIQKHPSFSS